jgi:hypothetical protein
MYLRGSRSQGGPVREKPSCLLLAHAVCAPGPDLGTHACLTHTLRFASRQSVVHAAAPCTALLVQRTQGSGTPVAKQSLTESYPLKRVCSGEHCKTVLAFSLSWKYPKHRRMLGWRRCVWISISRLNWCSTFDCCNWALNKTCVSAAASQATLDKKCSAAGRTSP